MWLLQEAALRADVSEGICALRVDFIFLFFLNFRLFLTWKNTVFLSLERQDVLPWLCRSLELRKSVPRAVSTLPGFQLNLIKISIELPSFEKSLISARKLFISVFSSC